MAGNSRPLSFSTRHIVTFCPHRVQFLLYIADFMVQSDTLGYNLAQTDTHAHPLVLRHSHAQSCPHTRRLAITTLKQVLASNTHTHSDHGLTLGEEGVVLCVKRPGILSGNIIQDKTDTRSALRPGGKHHCHVSALMTRQSNICTLYYVHTYPPLYIISVYIMYLQVNAGIHLNNYGTNSVHGHLLHGFFPLIIRLFHFFN